MNKMKCIRSTYALFAPGEEYELKNVGEAGRFTVYEYVLDGSAYRFGLDENGENETDGNLIKFVEVK